MAPRLLFIAPWFFFPADTGGRIRTSQILRRMKASRFEITLCSPTLKGQAQRHAVALEEICDRFVGWPMTPRGPFFKVSRMRHILSSLPISVQTDRSAAGRRVVSQELSLRPDLV